MLVWIAPDRRQILITAVAVTAGMSPFALGQSRYPTKPVRLIVPFPPGQASDTYARMLAQHLSAMWKQQVYVDNRPGGVGVPAMLAAKDAAADGYTLMMASTSTLSINPVLHPDLPYNPLRDFVAVSNVVVQPLVLVAHPSFAPQSIQQLVAAAKASSTPLQFASPGQGTAQHLTAELFAARAGIKLEHIPYKGSGPAMLDLLGGQVRLMADSVTSALPHIKSGKIRAIAVTTAQRVSQLPDVPTIAESGYPGFEGAGWTGIVLPAHTPRELVERISADIQYVLKDAQMRAEIIAKGGIPDPRTPSAYTEFIRAETDKWAKVIKDAHVHAEE
jgi:tripartite-type tricarboxylate transporter receptor subunit TctC